MAPNFEDILDRPIGQTERPKPLPVGPYYWAVKGPGEHGESAKKQTPQIVFTCVCLGPVNDKAVDEEQLETWLTNADGSRKKLTDVEMKLTFYKVDSVLWRLQQFLEHLGFNPKGEESYNQLLAEVPGKEFIGTIKHQLAASGGGSYAVIDSTAPIQD